MSQRKKVVLAYSGGLDTSCILRVLTKQDYDVIAYIANVGQREDFELVQRRAEQIGAVKTVIQDLRQSFVTDYIYPAIAANAVYENRYLLGTSLARPIIAAHQVALAEQEGAHAVAHGATGKGNDQVRFELAYAALAPHLKVIAPWKDLAFLTQFKGRSDLIRYAKNENIPVDATVQKPYSTDENLLHKSYEAGILEDPNATPDAAMYTRTCSPQDAPDKPVDIELHFKSAMPVRLINLTSATTFEEPLALFEALNELAGKNAIGRVDIVENRFVGIKSRGVYETPAGTVLHAALRDLEGLAMDREVLHLRDSWAPKFAQLIYNGFWFSPEMDFIRAAFAQSQARIEGCVRLRLYKGTIAILGRSSPVALYNQELSSMDVAGGYDQQDAAGFIRLNAIRVRGYNGYKSGQQK